jgi:thiol:disulfide interchange protein DsbA
MRFLRFALAALGLVAVTAFASPTDPKLGADYVALATPQPVQSIGKKVEVIEFFMYHCPFCNMLEPMLADWVKKQGDKILFRRVHVPFSGPNDPEAHLFLTLEAMGQLDAMHAKVFRATHIDRVRMNKDEVIFDWVAKNGVNRAQFIDTWNSFGVQTKMRRLAQVISAYQVTGAPTLIIDGRLTTGPGVIDAGNKGFPREQLSMATVQVLDALVARALQTK